LSKYVTKDKLVLWFWIIFPAYIMIHVMSQVAPSISRWNIGVLSFICFMAWTQFIEWEVEKFQEKQNRRRRAILRERLNKYDR
jgi:hypothetical protein